MRGQRIVFMGSADLALPSLQAIHKEGHELVAVVTQPDRPKGRALKLSPSAIKARAMDLGIPVLQPVRARDENFISQIETLRADLIVVVAYGQILPEPLLRLPKFGSLNVHTSLLPKYRGAAPMQWAILNGDSETGVTIMKMDAGLDTGDVLTQSVTPIEATDDFASVHDRLAQMGASLLVQTIPDVVSNRIQGRKQSDLGEASYARKITKRDGEIDWQKPPTAVWNQIRALNPWPGAFTFHRGMDADSLLKVWRSEVTAGPSANPGEILQADAGGVVVACAGGNVRLLELQREGGRRLQVAEFLAGRPLPPGTFFRSKPAGVDLKL